ncbi:hypothetical protein KIN20_037304 [Parelaphostrongylus tenuis]|uniref:Uncharacterized protein n=1 Tax=Parelaphostrongylus tenuis TaxID=148309 RepID=A0AAD5REI0_PARTN|nr:hypothetical protein KIN20_037304 [Parelaphostrongylus tenuis]
MVCMQTVFYATECGVLLAISLLNGFVPTLTHIFALQVLRTMVVVQLLASLSCGVALTFVVQRSKQCLDFSCTIHAFHLLFVIIYNYKLPTQLLWWGVQIASIVVCTLLGEFLCMRAESQDIKLGGPSSKFDLVSNVEVYFSSATGQKHDIVHVDAFSDIFVHSMPA